MADKTDDGAWFAPKRFGYGAGLPIAWQGWVAKALHLALIASGAIMLKHQLVAVIAWVSITILLPLPFIAAKTRGGWKWRWGDGR